MVTFYAYVGFMVFFKPCRIGLQLNCGGPKQLLLILFLSNKISVLKFEVLVENPMNLMEIIHFCCGNLMTKSIKSGLEIQSQNYPNLKIVLKI